MMPDGWQEVLLGDAAALVMGQAPPSSSVVEDGSEGLPFIQGNAEFGTKYPTPLKTCAAPARVAQPGDILISVRAPVGALNRANTPIGIGRGLAAIRPTSIDTEYAWFAILQNVSALSRVSQGSTFAAVNKDDLSGLVLRLPPHREQRKIASILSAVDDAIEATQAVVDQLEVVKRAMMAELLTRGLPGRHARFRQTDVGQVPEDWDVVRLEQLCSELVDCPHSTPKYVDSGFPVIRTADVIPGRMLVENAKHVSEETLRDRVRRLVPIAGDIFYSREGERLGIAAPVPADTRTCLGQRMMHLRASADTDPSFLCWLMNAPVVYAQAVGGTGGSTSPHVNVGTVRAFAAPRPPREEQVKIGAALDSVERRIAQEEHSLKGSKTLKAALMSVLLSGEVRVKPDEDAA